MKEARHQKKEQRMNSQDVAMFLRPQAKKRTIAQMFLDQMKKEEEEEAQQQQEEQLVVEDVDGTESAKRTQQVEGEIGTQEIEIEVESFKEDEDFEGPTKNADIGGSQILSQPESVTFSRMKTSKGVKRTITNTGDTLDIKRTTTTA